MNKKPSYNILLTYSINGSLRKRETTQPQQNTEYYLFNSQGNLKAYSDDIMDFAYYGYNAANTRTYKLSLYNTNLWINGQQQPLNMQLQQAMFYPNTYLNFNGNGEYTKHYYNGMERIASRLGDNNTTIAIDNMLENRKLLLEEQVRNEIQELISETPQVDMPPMLDILNLQPTGTPNDIYYYHPNHLGSTSFVTDGNATITQGFLYAPFGEITTEYNINFGNNVIPKYSFNAKEFDEETGMYYYEARYYKPPVFTSRDPMFEKYFWMSPYTYCANNPINVIDPNGMDTVNIKYNTTDNKWEIGKPVLAEGDDVYNVTDATGNITTHTFSEGTYKNRMNIILLEDNFDDANGVDESFGVYHLSGTNETGFVLQPSENQKGHNYNGVGEYTSFIGEGEYWNNYIGIKLSVTDAVDEGIRIHYGTGRSWSKGCLIISSEYSNNGNKPKSFNLAKSQAAVCALAKYAGGTPKGTKQMGTTRTGAPRYRDYYTYGKFTAPTVTIKK